jgi:hypothetical protein
LVYICEPEVGITLNDEEGRSSKDLINCQERKDELSGFHMGNGRISMIDLGDCQVSSDENSYFQVGNGGRLLKVS